MIWELENKLYTWCISRGFGSDTSIDPLVISVKKKFNYWIIKNIFQTFTETYSNIPIDILISIYFFIIEKKISSHKIDKFFNFLPSLIHNIDVYLKRIFREIFSICFKIFMFLPWKRFLLKECSSQSISTLEMIFSCRHIVHTYVVLNYVSYFGFAFEYFLCSLFMLVLM